MKHLLLSLVIAGGIAGCISSSNPPPPDKSPTGVVPVPATSLTAPVGSSADSTCTDDTQKLCTR